MGSYLMLSLNELFRVQDNSTLTDDKQSFHLYPSAPARSFNYRSAFAYVLRYLLSANLENVPDVASLDSVRIVLMNLTPHFRGLNGLMVAPRTTGAHETTVWRETFLDVHTINTHSTPLRRCFLQAIYRYFQKTRGPVHTNTPACILEDLYNHFLLISPLYIASMPIQIQRLCRMPCTVGWRCPWLFHVSIPYNDRRRMPGLFGVMCRIQDAGPGWTR